MQKPNNTLLKYFWFKTEMGLGIGVTAFSLEDAESIIQKDAFPYLSDKELSIISYVENVKIKDLDQGHVVPNMHPMTFRGIWFPKLKVL